MSERSIVERLASLETRLKYTEDVLHKNMGDLEKINNSLTYLNGLMEPLVSTTEELVRKMEEAGQACTVQPCVTESVEGVLVQSGLGFEADLRFRAMLVFLEGIGYNATFDEEASIKAYRAAWSFVEAFLKEEKKTEEREEKKRNEQVK